MCRSLAKRRWICVAWVDADVLQKPMRSTLPQIRFLQTDSDKASPAHELPSSGTDKVCPVPVSDLEICPSSRARTVSSWGSQGQQGTRYSIQM
jgi:hypothetical protein